MQSTLNLETVPVGSKEGQMKWLRISWRLLVAVVITWASRMLVDSLSALFPAAASLINPVIGILFIVLIVVLVMKPLLKEFGIREYKPKDKG